MHRVDALIHELAHRCRNDDQHFLAAVRPVVADILDERTPVVARGSLLELLAETFERDAKVRRDLASARASWAAFAASLQSLLRG